MSVPSTSTNEIVSSKQYFVNRVSGNNDIDTSTYSVTFTSEHDFITGEKKLESSVKMEHCLTDWHIIDLIFMLFVSIAHKLK